MYVIKLYNELENEPVCPFGSNGPTGEVSLLYHVHFARYEPKPRT